MLMMPLIAMSPRRWESWVSPSLVIVRKKLPDCSKGVTNVVLTTEVAQSGLPTKQINVCRLIVRSAEMLVTKYEAAAAGAALAETAMAAMRQKERIESAPLERRTESRATLCACKAT